VSLLNNKLCKPEKFATVSVIHLFMRKMTVYSGPLQSRNIRCEINVRHHHGLFNGDVVILGRLDTRRSRHIQRITTVHFSSMPWTLGGLVEARPYLKVMCRSGKFRARISVSRMFAKMVSSFITQTASIDRIVASATMVGGVFLVCLGNTLEITSHAGCA
jgi:hypothetical protein